jgi:pimeloyl-ACP methyl ester carboxylesterase
LLFLHSVNATASSYEMKPLYEHYARERKVYALDLPGFGFSEREDRPYTPELYRNLINEFISKELRGGAVDAVALSLSSEFLALAAMAKPEHFRSLTFISPTGMSTRDMRVKAHDELLRLLLNPTWSRLIFDTMTSRPSIRHFTQLSQTQPGHRGFAHYAYVTSHQPNAQVAPFYFAAGKLFTPSIFMVYQKLTQPILMIYGRGSATRYDMVDELNTQLHWRVVPFNRCGDLAHYDDPKGVIAQMDQLFTRI